MKSKLVQAILILATFLIFVVDILNLPEYMSTMHYGILHPNSILFIGVITVILCLSIDKDIKDAKRLHIQQETSVKDSIKAFEEFFENKISTTELVAIAEKNNLVERTLQLIKYGAIEEDLVLSVQKVFSEIAAKYVKLKNDYEYAATVMPIIGMVGTIAGLLIMFAVPEGLEDFADKFSGLSISLATTLYASLVTILIFKPKARDIEEWIVNLDSDHEECEIAVKQFFHKVDMFDLLEECDKRSQNEVSTKTK